MSRLSLKKDFNFSDLDKSYHKTVQSFLNWIGRSYDIIFYKPLDFINTISFKVNEYLEEIKETGDYKESTLNFKRRALKEFILLALNEPGQDDYNKAVKLIVGEKFNQFKKRD